MLIHVPHSYNRLPIELIDKIHEKDFFAVTDWYTDELFHCVGADKVIFPLSRLVCDVERLIDDPLDNDGYGIHTIKTINGTIYRDKSNIDETMDIYYSWHTNVKKMVEHQKHFLERVVVIDAHSFDSFQVMNYKGDLPDICIGTNDSTTGTLADIVIGGFKNLGYSVKENEPYAGAIRVNGAESIMIEVNKRLYLDSDFKKLDTFEKLSNDIEEVLNRVLEYEISGS